MIRTAFTLLAGLLSSLLIMHMLVLFGTGLHKSTQTADAILIFGNKVETTGIPSKRLQSRLDTGLGLYNQNRAPLIIVSGGFGKEGYDEALIMRQYLIDRGMPSQNIIVDSDGNNTYATARNFKTIVSDHNLTSVILISQYYHLMRAAQTFRNFGIADVYTYPAQMFPELRDLYSIPREIIGYYVYLFKDYS